ncbi:LysR family transcriptional regulator, hydrogen peroxide-inducible genes activator [Paracoccus isoporae]|uniref:LysR family transcriptional regulator, hydrogen peroxide-inducible genes activator n=1 Tax=Paracoccus isoporae TaxID=591205 RepID=A0A1G6TX70_9RHOB|nr:hydrogen peroxide-inducible genes activator [Paracoccus isoporae]SDD33046.1 LysR family transcriptional regulator, hydrogen peroxide-inducible genes activator [Paracoccus isoporae]
MQSLTLKQLRYFEALARTGQFGLAADDCAITQPALSMQIKDLELLVGAPLVERGTRRVRLTALGQQFAARAREILRSVDELGDLVRADGDSLSGPLRIGVIPTVAPYLLPRLIAALHRQFPALDPQPRETVTPRLIRDLAEARIDIAIVALPVSEPTLQETPLFDEEFVLVRPASERDRPVPLPEHLQEERLLLLEEGHCFRDQALSFCKMAQAPRGLMEGSSLSTLVQMVGAGIGVTLIPEMAIDLETRSANVSVARLSAPRPTRTIGMVWRRSNPLADRFEQIAGIVTDLGQPTADA